MDFTATITLNFVDSIPDYRDALRASIALLSSRVTKGRRYRDNLASPHIRWHSANIYGSIFGRKKWYAALFLASPLRLDVMKARALSRVHSRAVDHHANRNTRQTSVPTSAKDRSRNPKRKARKATIPWRRSEFSKSSKGSISNIPMSPVLYNTKVPGSYWSQRFSLRKLRTLEST